MNVFCGSGDVKVSEALQTEGDQLTMEAEKRLKEVEELNTALQHKSVEAEEKTKEVEELQAALDGGKKELEERNSELRMMTSELDEFNKLLEEKSVEADESIDKYCGLMVKVLKLEETNDALTTRLEQLTASHRANEAKVPTSGAADARRRRSARKPSSNHREEPDKNSENISPSSPRRSAQGSSSAKRGHRDISNEDSAQEALHNLTKKIKANAVTTPKPRAGQEDEFKPEGLPELVQRGTLRSNTHPLEL